MKIICKGNFRTWKYVATLNWWTGELIHITAGCRQWPTFLHAFRHYSSVGEVNVRWSDAWISVMEPREAQDWITNRAEARLILLNLQRAILAKQHAPFRRLVRWFLNRRDMKNDPRSLWLDIAIITSPIPIVGLVALMHWLFP